MHRMSVLSLCIEDDTIDTKQCVVLLLDNICPKRRRSCALLATVHDLAEAEVGDIAPSHGISKADKTRLETAAMDHFTLGMLNNGKGGKRLRELWDVSLVAKKSVHIIPA